MAYRHRCWWRERKRVRAALCDADATSARLDRFDACGTAAWILRDPRDPDRLRIASSNCHDRFCQPCASARSHAVACNLRDLIAQDRHRFVTLTLRHSDAPLRDQLERLYRHYRRLRQRRLWTRAVTAAAAFLEIKRSRDGRRWHPHLHVLCKSDWIAQAALSSEWLNVTGDSSIIDIRAVRNDDAARYVAKYATKALKTEYAQTPALLAEAVTALHRRRLIVLSGAWTGAKLTETPEPEGWEPVAPLNHILALAAAGNASAIDLLQRLERTPECTAASDATPPTALGP